MLTRQDKAGQGKTDMDRNTGESQVDQTKSNSKDRTNIQGIITDNETNTAGTYLTHNDRKQGQETNQIWTQEVGTDDTHNITLTISSTGIFVAIANNTLYG